MYGVILSSPCKWGSFRRSVGVALATTLCLGTVTMPGVWAATFYVDAVAGSDANDEIQAQSPATPWQSITRAIGEATLAAGDEIRVAAGTYDQALETFPLYLVDGVALIGDPNDPNSRVIGAPAGEKAFSNDNTPLAAGTTLTGFRINHDTGLSGDAAMQFLVGSVAMAPEIRDNVFVGNASTGIDGIHVEDRNILARSFTGLIEDNTFVDLGTVVELYLNDHGTPTDISPTIRGNTFADCDYPIYASISDSFSGVASPTIVGNTATGSSTDVYLFVELSSGHGPTFAPLINNNPFSGSDYASLYMSVGTMSLSSSTDTVTFSPTILNNTITDAGDEGMYFYFDDLEYCNFASDMTIAGNTITNPGGAGIYLETTSFSDGHSMLVDWTISNNTITFGAAGADDGIEIEATDALYYIDGGHLNLTVAGNTITGALDGIDIRLTEFSSTEIGLSVTIQGNTITNSNDDGIYFRASTQTYFTDSDVKILDNVSDGNLGDGLGIVTNDFPVPTSYVEVACNTIVNNGENGVLQFQYGYGDIPPDYGGGDLLSPGLNTLMGNGTVSGYDFFNGHPGAVAAHNNWWGTTDTGVIDANIWDNADDPSKGVVAYSGFLSAAPTVSATASLVDALEVDLSPPGPSYGDTIRYTATLQGTGDCGCASALFTVPIPNNGIFIPDSLTASRGILINKTVSTLHPELIVGLGALEAAETVTITWDVIAGGVYSMTSQATLSCYQLGNLLTDDPDVGGSADPTTTVLDHRFSDGFESGDTDMWSNAVP